MPSFRVDIQTKYVLYVDCTSVPQIVSPLHKGLACALTLTPRYYQTLVRPVLIEALITRTRTASEVNHRLRKLPKPPALREAFVLYKGNFVRTLQYSRIMIQLSRLRETKNLHDCFQDNALSPPPS